MKLVIILGFCLIAASACRNTDTAQRSYGLYNPYYQPYQGYSPYNYNYYYYQQPYYYYGRYAPYNYEYYKYQQPYYYYGKTNSHDGPQEYYKPYYYNSYYYKHPYYNSDYYYGDKTRTGVRSAFGQSGYESNHNLPLYYAPGHDQGYKSYSNDYPDLKQVKEYGHVAHAVSEAKSDIGEK